MIGEQASSLEGINMNVYLVYQAGIANVFLVDAFDLNATGLNVGRLLQGSFHECETFVRGMARAGASVRTAHCNQAGDISGAQWFDDLENAPFSDSHCPVKAN